MEMYDIIVNGNLVAICAEGVLKLFVESLIRVLGAEMSIQTQKHVSAPEHAPIKKDSKKE